MIIIVVIVVVVVVVVVVTFMIITAAQLKMLKANQHGELQPSECQAVVCTLACKQCQNEFVAVQSAECRTLSAE